MYYLIYYKLFFSILYIYIYAIYVLYYKLAGTRFETSTQRAPNSISSSDLVRMLRYFSLEKKGPSPSLSSFFLLSYGGRHFGCFAHGWGKRRRRRRRSTSFRTRRWKAIYDMDIHTLLRERGKDGPHSKPRQIIYGFFFFFLPPFRLPFFYFFFHILRPRRPRVYYIYIIPPSEKVSLGTNFSSIQHDIG